MAALQEQMTAPDFWSNQENAQTVSQDYQDLKNEVDKWEELKKKSRRFNGARAKRRRIPAKRN